ncbi:MAG: geranylgeranylglyceryl/heptaprenylglyceryl phosphate synthase [Conexivisphaerales archaeon]
MDSKVDSYILRELGKKKALVFALLDSDNITAEAAPPLARRVAEAGVDAILVGGSTAIDQLTLDAVVTQVKKHVTIPVILFPGNVTGVSPGADAILFASLLNSEDPYFITGAQALGSSLVRKYNIEALPTGYIIAGEGGTAGFVGRARPFPQNKPELVALYALAAQYLGMKYVYLEAGSGATSNIPAGTVKTVRGLYKGMLIVGGGIRDGETARAAVEAGADILVIGNLLETRDFDVVLRQIVETAHLKGPKS